MANNDNGVIGIGRANDSSSSRESSPAIRRQPRSFSPTSDDGDLAVPSVPQDDDVDTPPPEGASAPLIRQAVGFSWAPQSSASITTYQATLPAKPVPHFLPGQEVLASQTRSQTPQSNTTKKASSAKPKTTRKKKAVGDAFSAQTGKFRLTCSVNENFGRPTPAPTPTPAPYSSSVYPGSGPYSSLYRLGTGSSNATTPSGNSMAGSMSPAPGISSPGTSFSLPPDHTSSTSHNRNDSRSAHTPRSNTHHQSSRSKGKRRDKQPSQPVPRDVRHSYQSTTTDPQPGQSNYYRRDYERDRDASDMHDSLPHSAHSTMQPAPAHPSSSSAPANNAATQPRPISGPLRMVTLLIEDIRSGVSDSQLAEVKVPLKVATDPEYGFWAIAKDICEGLQTGPSRIDGPAKVYTLRGKYRQFFMRVSADNVFEAGSTNLGISSDRTLQIVVEAPVPTGRLPLPPNIPQNVMHASDSDSDGTHAPGEIRIMVGGLTRDAQVEKLAKMDYNTLPQKRDRSLSSDDSSNRHWVRPIARISPYSSPSPRPSPSSKRKRKTARRTEDIARASVSSRSDDMNQAGRSGRREHMASPGLGRIAESSEERDNVIANYIRSSIEGDPGWIQYMQSKAKPQRVSEVLKQYQFVQSKVQKLVGQVTPIHLDGAPNCPVEKEHVWHVLKLSTQWGSDCQETLSLVHFYGPNGSRYEDSRVVDMMNDTAPPRDKAMKRFLKFLREVDMDWARDHTASPDTTWEQDFTEADSRLSEGPRETQSYPYRSNDTTPSRHYNY